VWGGVGQLGAEAGEVAFHVLEDRAGGFDGEVLAGGPKGAGQFFHVRSDHRFAAGQDDVPGGVFAGLGEDFLDVHAAAFDGPGRVRRVAPGAAEIAAAGTDEDAGHAGQPAFALDAGVDFADEHDAMA